MPVIDGYRGFRGELPVGAKDALGQVAGHGGRDQLWLLTVQTDHSIN